MYFSQVINNRVNFVSVQREFRTNEGDDDFATHPPIVVDRIVMDVCPKAGNGNTGLPTGAPAVIDNVLQTIDFAYVGVISELYRNGLDYFSGIIANVKYYLGGVLIHTWDIAKEALSEIDLIAGTLLTFVNSAPSNWGLFDKQANGDWLGQELVVNGGFDNTDGWTLGAGWSISDGLASHVSSSTSNLNQSANPLRESSVYLSSFSVTDVTPSVDGVRIRIGSGGNGVLREEEGTYSEIITATNNELLFTANAFFTGSIDNVSVKEVLKNA